MTTLNSSRCLLITSLFIAFFALPTASAQTIRWLKPDMHKLTASACGFKQQRVTDNYWQAITTDPVYPKLTIGSFEIDANQTKYLYIKMASTNRNSLRIFCSPDNNGPFYSRQSFKTSPLRSKQGWSIYRLNLSSVPFWKETIRSLRIYMPGHYKTDTVRFASIGVSSEPVYKDGQTEVVELAVNTAIDAHNRMAAWQDTMVSTNDTLPNSFLMTYLKDKANNVSHQYILAKLVPGIEAQNGPIWTDNAQRALVEDFPGGIKAEFNLGNVKVTTKITALTIGRDDNNWHGAAIYTIKTQPATPIIIRCASGDAQWQHMLSVQRWALDSNVAFKDSKVILENNFALLNNPVHPLTVGIKTDGQIRKKANEQNDEYLNINFEKGTGQILLTFAEDKNQAIKLFIINPAQAVNKVHSYYGNLLDNRKISTPEQVINDAFRTAVITMDYCWYDPLGWIEGIHHWVAMWHQQHTAAAQWLGHADRAKACIVSHADKLINDGAIPHLVPAGTVRRDFGGANQFYFWQIRQYLKYTNDLKTLRHLAPILDKVLDFTYREHDSDKNLLLAWGQQIGNQEDLLATPFDGSVPTIEGINMMRTRAMVADALGDKKTVELMQGKIHQAMANLRSQLWMPDLGRFMYYKDPTGQARLDGQYETYIYPVIWNITDPLDSYTSLRYLRDRLIGTDGEVYCSNNFPNHLLEIWATWGMQAGAAQQPWGAWGLAAAGLRNETYRPLKAVSQWVNNDLQRGSWPEVANENRLGYFSPPAAMFIQSTIEALFGLQIDRPKNTLTVSPSFPDHWPKAELTLPEFSANYTRKENALKYQVKSKDPLIRKLRWMLPPCQVKQVKVDGKEINFKIIPDVNCVILQVQTIPSRDTTFEVKINPLKYEIDYPASIAQGDTLELDVNGISIESIDDRCSVLSQTRIKKGKTLQATIRKGLLDKYLKFGRLGQMTFSRRSFFLLAKPKKGTPFWLPVDLMILPQYEAAAKGQLAPMENGAKVTLLVRNNTSLPLNGTAYLKTFENMISFQINIDPRSEDEFTIAFTQEDLKHLSHGDNYAVLILPGNVSIDLILTASELTVENPELVQNHIVPVKLPEDSLMPDTQWKTVRQFYAYYEYPAPIAQGDSILDKFEPNLAEFTVPELPGVTFNIDNRRFVPISAKLNKPRFTLRLDPGLYKKIYLLLIPFVKNHDVFAEVGRIELQLDEPHPSTGLAVISRTLCCPGDLDWWVPRNWMCWMWGGLGTYPGPRLDRHHLLPLLDKNTGDWDIAKPPVFPQRQFWTTTLPVTSNVTMNIIQIDLGQPRKLKSLTVSTLGTDPAIGLVAVTAEKNKCKQIEVR